MSDNSPPVRVMDVIPREVLNRPFEQKEYHDNMVRFLRVGAIGIVVGSGSIVLFFIGVGYAYVLSSFLLFSASVFPLLIGVFIFLAVFLTYQNYQDQRENLAEKDRNHDEVKRQVINIAAQIQYNYYVVQKGGMVINGSSATPSPEPLQLPFPTPTPEIPTINETYELALKITKVGLEAWSVNGGKRPSEKPFSAVKMKEYLGIGSEKWQEVIGLISDSHVMSRPDSKTWTPNAKDMGEAKSLLDKYLVSQGYYLNRNGKTETWMKV